MGNVISTIVSGGQIRTMVRPHKHYEPKLVDMPVGMVRPIDSHGLNARIVPVHSIKKGEESLDVEDVETVKEHMGF